MKASFIIPLFNGLPLTQAMLASLQATLPAGLEHEIILVDDGSTDGTREWAPKLDQPCHSLLNERNLGFAATCNRGAAVATGEFLFFLNNDLILLPGWLEPMLALAARPSVALVGNVQLNATTGAVDHTGVFFNAKGKPEHHTDRPLAARLVGVRPVTALTGACFAIRRPLWRSFGGFDEGFVNGGEDIDLCLRARRAGFRNLVSLASVVRHHISASPGRKMRDEQNSRRLLQRWQQDIACLVARANCRAFLDVAWDEPRQYPDPVLARDAFLHGTWLALYPSRRLCAAVGSILQIEFARWSHLLDGGPPPRPKDEIVREFRPLPPPEQLVL